MDNNLIKNRKKVYTNLPKKDLTSVLSNMVLNYHIKDSYYSNLVNSVQKYICKSLSLAYNKEFTWTDTFLADNDALISGLSNKTPNGVIVPKLETSEEYNSIQNSINDIFTHLGLWPHIKKIYYPNIRYKNSHESLETKNRPYYTGKYHSDAWVGHVGDSIFFIGVLGDVKGNTVEFNEPLNVKDNYLTKADSFDDGLTRCGSFKYLGCLEEQQLTIMDHACLHRTLIKPDSTPRVSIDIPIMIDSKYSHMYSQEFNQIPYLYIDGKDVSLIGKDKKYVIEESIFDNTKTIFDFWENIKIK